MAGASITLANIIAFSLAVFITLAILFIVSKHLVALLTFMFKKSIGNKISFLNDRPKTNLIICLLVSLIIVYSISYNIFFTLFNF